MHIYVAKVFKSQATGSVMKEVCCEHCGCHFYYQLARCGIGEAEAAYYLGQNAAKERAEERARQNLANMLAKDVEVVPCPGCDKLQTSMIEYVRRKIYRPLRTLAYGIPIIGLVVVGILALISSLSHRRGDKIDWSIYAILTAISVGIGVALGLLRRSLLPSARSPRGSWFEWATRGAAPALLPADDPAQPGQVVLQPFARPEADAKPKKWVVFPAARIALPNVCCECLAPATTTLKTPYKVEAESDMGVPLCANCAGRLRLRWWGYLGLTLVGCVLAGAALIYLPILPRKVDKTGHWIIGVLTAVFSIPFAAAIIPGLLTRPYRVKSVDTERGIIRLRFRNPNYTLLLRGLVDTLEGQSGDVSAKSG